MDQITFASNLRCIAHPQLTGSKPEDLCCPALHQLYMSLLGAVAYLSHTRVDVVVFISAGQRFAQKPQIQHVRRLNKLLLWIQRNPKKLIYRRSRPAVLRAHTSVWYLMQHIRKKPMTDTVFEELCTAVVQATQRKASLDKRTPCTSLIGHASHKDM